MMEEYQNFGHTHWNLHGYVTRIYVVVAVLCFAGFRLI